MVETTESLGKTEKQRRQKLVAMYIKRISASLSIFKKEYEMSG